MFRSITAVALLLVMLVVAPTVAAQDASPAASPGAMTDVTIEHLGNLEVAPGFVLPVVRVELAPSASLPPHSSRVPALARVESGQVDYIVIEGAARRATVTMLVPTGTPTAGMGTPDAGTGMAQDVLGTPAADATPGMGMLEGIAIIEEEVILLGEETPLSAGEAVFFGPDVVHTFRNSGDEPAVLLIIGDLPPGELPLQMVEEDATPAGSPMGTPAS